MSLPDTHYEQPSEARGFFRPSKFHLWSTAGLALLSAISLSPLGFDNTVGGTVLVNLLLVLIMILALVVLILDLFITSHDSEGVST